METFRWAIMHSDGQIEISVPYSDFDHCYDEYVEAMAKLTETQRFNAAWRGVWETKELLDILSNAI